MSTTDMKSSLHRFRVTSRASPSSQSDPSPMSDRPPSEGGSEKPLQLSSAAKPSHIPACDSRTFPVCSLCASAGTKCSFSTPASSSDAQTHHLRARVEWLTSYFNQALPLGAPAIETIETGADLTELVQWIANTAALSQGHSPGSAISSTQNVLLQGNQLMVDHRNLDPGIDGQSRRHSSVHQPVIHQSTEAFGRTSHSAATDGGHVLNQRLPPNAAARRFVDAYFRNVNRAYPFVDRNKVLHDLETLGDFPKRNQDADSTLLYLIMAIGCTTLQRAGQIPADMSSKFEVSYPDIIQECLSREGIESIQILVLLSLYSLFDPTAPSAWSLVGIAARQAMLFGLTRRTPEGRSISPTEIELRHRLLWSVYVLDRMMATSLGLPAALTDENLDVPLPGLTVDEFASPERSQFASILQTSRHVIMLRQIEGRILDQVHLLKQSKISTLNHADRRSIVQDIRADIENWYSNGCLVSPLEPDNVPIHNSITWLSARYYYLLVLLYYPSHFNSAGSVVSKAEVLRFAQKHIQSTSVLFQQRQLPLNRVTLFRTFPIGLVLIHGFMACAAECAPYPAREEVTMLINILEAFSDGWTHARQASQILRQFITIVNSGPGDYLQFPNNAFVGGQMSNSRESALISMVRPMMTSFTELMQEALGRITCYSMLEVAEERPSGRMGSFASHSSANGTGRGSMASTRRTGPGNMSSSTERYTALVDWIQKGDAIVDLPLSKTLSYLNAISGHPEVPNFSHETFTPPPNTTFFSAGFIKEVPPHVIGRFVLMQQYLLGNKSEWWPYIASLPQPEHIGGMLPALWPEDDVDFLQGTNAYVAVQEIKATLKKEYKDAIKLLPETFRSTYTKPLYLWSYAIFTSRSFRPSLVLPETESMKLPCAIDDFSVLLPLYDLGNHSPFARSSWDADHESQQVSLKCGEPYEVGQQIFNNYGMKTNAELLLGYGFMLPETEQFHNDYIHIKTKVTSDDDFAGTHIVSLRPLSDPSSVVGLSRRLTSRGVQVVPEFSHIQDSLVSSLYDAITAASGDGDTDSLSMDDIMAGNLPRAIHERIVQALGSKLTFDLDTLEEIEVPREGLNSNQQIAVQYRDQCQSVFENALRSLTSAMAPE
ncbi:hypothetical protein E8E14_002985 [Neopestalotiopsis sp. 37M]|nr:hypothetical protein E8E14_002985 [Neopestalotiopsis sp. 37M]